jgi:hypothetical protein
MPGKNDSVTIFAIPKPFEGHDGIIQRNAVRSWAALGIPIILLCDDPGVEEMAAEVGATFVPDLPRNDLGTPLLDAAFRIAGERAETDLIAYTNCDIIFTESPAIATRQLPYDQFLGVGLRYDTDITEELDFNSEDWPEVVRKIKESQSAKGWPACVDYFIIPRVSPLTGLPPFAVGRPAWDNWMCAKAWDLHFPLVDLTEWLLAVHQNHGYGHVKEGTGRLWEGREAEENRELGRGLPGYFGIDRATYTLEKSGRLRPVHRNLARMLWRMPGPPDRSGPGKLGARAHAVYHMAMSGNLPRAVLRRFGVKFDDEKK